MAIIKYKKSGSWSNLVLDTVYPVGISIISKNAPSSIFGGTWVRNETAYTTSITTPGSEVTIQKSVFDCRKTVYPTYTFTRTQGNYGYCTLSKVSNSRYDLKIGFSDYSPSLSNYDKVKLVFKVPDWEIIAGYGDENWISNSDFTTYKEYSYLDHYFETFTWYQGWYASDKYIKIPDMNNWFCDENNTVVDAIDQEREVSIELVGVTKPTTTTTRHYYYLRTA